MPRSPTYANVCTLLPCSLNKRDEAKSAGNYNDGFDRQFNLGRELGIILEDEKVFGNILGTLDFLPPKCFLGSQLKFIGLIVVCL